MVTRSSASTAPSFLSSRLLLAQSFQHGINVSVGDFNNRFFNFDRVQTLQFNFRIHFELYRVGEVFAQFVFARNVVRRAGRIDFSLMIASTK